MKKTFYVGLVVLATLVLTGCATPRDRDFFAEDGIAVGVPDRGDDGVYRIPIEFTTAMVHSGLELHKVVARIEGDEIVIHAKYGLVREGIHYGGVAFLPTARPGDYRLIYRDRDGARHPVGPVVLP